MRRNRISNEHRERIVKAFQDPHEDYLFVADMLEVNRSTAIDIVATFVREVATMDIRKKKGRREATWRPQQCECRW